MYAWSTGVVKMITIILMVIMFEVGFFLWPLTSEYLIRINPVQQEQAEVVGKRTVAYYRKGKEQKIPHCFITFQLLDGTKKELNVMHTVFEALHEGDTGVLSFQEQDNASNASRRYFVSFQDDQDQSSDLEE